MLFPETVEALAILFMLEAFKNW